MMAANEAAMEKPSTAQPSAFETLRSVKVRKLTEDMETRVDLIARKPLQALCAKALAGKGAHHTAVIHGVTPGGGRECFLGSEIAEESSGKAVARAGRIDDFLQRERRSSEGAQLGLAGF